VDNGYGDRNLVAAVNEELGIGKKSVIENKKDENSNKQKYFLLPCI
jgi:hypothetical protein